MAYISFTATPTTSALSICNAQQGIDLVRQFLIIVRSMGTASYIALGGVSGQSRRLVSVGDNLAITPIFSRTEVSLGEIYIISDTSDAVLEVIAEGA